MAVEPQNLFLFVIYVVVINYGIMMMTVRAETGKTDAPIFIFGDSTVDVGTNNYLETCTARADHGYHGIDFPFSRPTGRSSNGKNAADQIVSMLGNYKLSPPPFLSLLAHKTSFKSSLLRGANFASGGAGVFIETGQIHFHRVISLEEQIQQFATVRGNITELLGSQKAVDLLQKSIYLISIGNNDLVEYEATHIGRLELDPFMANVTQAYATHLTNLYNLGARKFAIVGLPPVGCSPAARAYKTSGCVITMNYCARLFYKLMQSVLEEFSFKFKGFKYSLGDTYNVTMNIIDNPRGNEFKEVTEACCGNGTTDCNVGVNLCTNRDDFLFWDWFHPTEKASELAALSLVYGEGAEYVTPMNFSTLAMIVDP